MTSFSPQSMLRSTDAMRHELLAAKHKEEQAQLRAAALGQSDQASAARVPKGSKRKQPDTNGRGQASAKKAKGKAAARGGNKAGRAQAEATKQAAEVRSYEASSIPGRNFAGVWRLSCSVWPATAARI